MTAKTMLTKDSTHFYYETHAKDYFQATHAGDLERLWRMLSQRLETPALILDLGCGSGRDLRFFASQGFSIVGLDYSFELLKLAKAFSGQPVVQADMRCLPFGKGSFEAVWAVASLLHLPRRDVLDVLIQIRSILKPGGLLLTSVKEGRGEHTEANGRCTVFYDWIEWKSLLIEAKYRIIEADGSVELRQSEDGKTTEIEWITTLTMG